MKITEQVWQFAEPLVQAQGCSLWDVEYVREGGEWFLRLYIDKDGGVDIDDCEAVSRAVDPVLDEKDPIPESYRFEVCSAGLERVLKRPSDFERFLGEPVLVKDRVDRPGDGLTVIDVHAAVLVDVQPQEPVAALLDVFHVPERAAVRLHHRLGKRPDLIGDLHGNSSFSARKSGEQFPTLKFTLSR